jgi:nicotinate-nucleotide adenylyltransferase
VFVPAGAPWQKARAGVTAPPDRYEMVRLAVDDNDAFEPSRVDIDREGPTYTVDTIAALAQQRPGAELYFITGADAILEILTWKDPDEMLGMARFVAVTRPGSDLAGLRELGIADRVTSLEIPALAISSTDIRARVRAGRPIRYLVPAPVERYIREHRLYTT